MVNNISQIKQESCFGCRSCEQACPKKVISIKENFEGFLFPEVSSDCVDCGICLSKCPAFNFSDYLNEKAGESYALISKTYDILMTSTSGGLFYILACSVLEKGGVVFGASYDSNLNVIQTKITAIEDLKKIQGSKYVACDTLQSFSEVKKLLEEKNIVLYSGSPCQIAGLYAFLGKKNFENLYTCDLICHGTPSQKCFHSYLNYLGRKEKKKIISYSFRDKSVHPLGAIAYKFSDGSFCKQKVNVFDVYGAAFARHENYKLSCYTCPFAQQKRVGDITIGDFWGIEKFNPSFPRDKGVSLALGNTKKGKTLLVENLDQFEYSIQTLENAARYNPCLNGPEKKPQERECFYEEFDEIDFWEKKKTEIPYIYYKNLFIYRCVKFVRKLGKRK